VAAPAEPEAEPEVAQRFLAGLADPIARLAREQGVIEAYLPTTPIEADEPLAWLTFSIIGQQISRRAARAVFGRLRDRLGGDLEAPALAALPEADLRELGFSYAKARAVRELAAAVASGELVFSELHDLSDAQAQARLVALRGIGPWSAQVFLLRRLRRPDVFPAGDMGLRRAIVSLDDLPRLPTVAEAGQRAVAWRPYRSYAAKYLWNHYAAGE